jgi:hypothetical protein
MKYAAAFVLVSVIALVACAWIRNSPPQEAMAGEYRSKMDWKDPKEVEDSVQPVNAADRAEVDLERELMVQETIMLWTMFLDDGFARKNDSRRMLLQEYAEALVDTVILYQDTPTDIGGQLPRHRNVHLLIAARVAKESSLRHDVVGAKGEVGLLQVMPNGPAIAGYQPEQVRMRPKLGLILGIRWLASRVPKCKRADVLDMGWDDYDWVGPLSRYIGGPKMGKPDGTCKSYKPAKDLVSQVLIYRTRIDHEMDSEV